jgi:hypothetical protein
MKKVIIFVLVLTSLFSCNEKTLKPKISKELIDLICEENIKQKKVSDSNSKKLIYRKYNSVYVYAKLNNRKFVETDFYELLKIYEKEFTSKFDSYNEFMFKVINEDFVLNEDDFIETATFQLDKGLKKEFESLSFEVFLKKYSLRKKDDKKLYLKDRFFSGNRYLTVSCLLYTKGYYLGGGCLGDGAKIYKFEDILLIK